ncbi:MAG: trehalase family glycosidase [Sulfolobales archaeon]
MRISDLVIRGKKEISGNISSAILGEGIGVDYYSYGEFIEARPLIRFSGIDSLTLLEHVWSLRGVERIFRSRVSSIRESLSIYQDTLSYRIKTDRSIKRVCFHGVIGHYGVGDDKLYNFMVGELGRPRHTVTSNTLRVESGDRGILIDIRSSDVFSIETKLTEDIKIFYKICFENLSQLDIIISDSETSFTHEEIALLRERYMIDLLNRAPEPPLRHARFRDLYTYHWYVILSNEARVKNHPILTSEFRTPSKYVFRHQWLWDSSFHAIVLTHYDLSKAKRELENLFNAQKRDGRIPHEIFLNKTLCKAVWGVDDWSPWTTQPPVIAVAVKRILDLEWDRDFAERSLRVLDRYDKWFREERDFDRDLLASYLDYLESGWDNSVRWDLPIELYERDRERYDTMYPRVRMAPVEAVDLNSLLYIQRRVIADIAERLGEKSLAEFYREIADKTAERIREFMWDDKTGFYYDILEENHEKILVRTPAAFLTLFSGVALREHADRLVEKLLDSREFWTTFPLPTVSASDPRYDPRGYWRGRSWVNIVWFTYEGLVKYGYKDVAERILERVLELMNRYLSAHENFDSSTGEPLGAVDFGWSTLIIDLMLRE